MFLHVIQAKYVTEYQVEVWFNNGRVGIADLTELVQKGKVFEPLQEVNFFAQLRVDEELSTLVWPNGADVAPEYIYFQAFKNEPELQKQFEVWGYLTPAASPLAK